MNEYEFWFLHYRREKVVDKLPRGKAEYLKAQIRRRLRTEDYMCRLPEEATMPKPRYRYKLRLQKIQIASGRFHMPIHMWVYK